MPPKKYKYDEKKKLFNDIELLSIDQQKEIFKIFHKNNVKYTENTNGIYIIGDNIEDKILREIEKFIKFCIEKNAQLKKEEEEFKNERDKFLGDKFKDDNNTDKEPEIYMKNKYMAKETYQTELSKYNLDLDDEETKKHNENSVEEIILNKNKPQYGGIRAKIIKGK